MIISPIASSVAHTRLDPRYTPYPHFAVASRNGVAGFAWRIMIVGRRRREIGPHGKRECVGRRAQADGDSGPAAAIRPKARIFRPGRQANRSRARDQSGDPRLAAVGHGTWIVRGGV